MSSWATQLKNKEAEAKAILANNNDAKTDGASAADDVAAVLKAGAANANASATPSATSPSNSERAALTYYLTLLRGSLVVAQLADGSCVEGLLHTLEFGSAGAAAAVVLHMAQRQTDAFAGAHVAEPRTYEARVGEPSLPRNTAYPFEGQRKIAMADLVQVAAADVNVAQWTQQYADYAAKHGLVRAGVGANSVSGGARGFATDSAISGGVEHERELVPWQPEGPAEALEAVTWGKGAAGTGQFNQFETFERMTGNKNTFKFDEYSTPLDRNSAFYKTNEARAQAIANSIVSSEATSAHQRLEREGAEDGPAFRDRDADEGDLFSDVRREAPGSATKAGTYKPGAFARQKQAGDVKKSPETPGSQPGSAIKSPKPMQSPTSPAPVTNGAAAAAAVPNGTAAQATAAEGVSPKPVDISLAAQQKVAEIAASPKEPAAAAASASAASSTAATTDSAAASSSAAAASASAPATTSDTAASTSAAASTTAAPVKSKLNAKAKEFKMSASAPAFTPSAAPAATPAAPAPAMVSMQMPMQAPMYGGPNMPLFPTGGVLPMGAGPMGAPFPLGVGGPQGPNPQMALLQQQMRGGMGPQPGQFFPQPTPQQMIFMQQQQLQMQMAAAAAAGLGGGAMNFVPQQQMGFQPRGGPGQQQPMFNPQMQQMQMQMQGPFPPHFQQPQQFGRQF